jgi:muconate cycloisomerase
MLEGAIGTIASAHLFSTFPNLTWGTELFGPLLLAQELVTEPLQYQDFELVVPTGLGLGVELDDERLRFFQRDAERRSISTASAQTGC